MAVRRGPPWWLWTLSVILATQILHRYGGGWGKDWPDFWLTGLIHLLSFFAVCAVWLVVRTCARLLAARDDDERP
ncbi:hypothetical protein [Roseateles sp. MS654]|uniref:hypothetical protein n=1 Tax=Roseateles sp. MS654 TaxID=3412685 RepID=UPI003C2CB509